MKKEINLDKIIDSVYNLNKDEDGNKTFYEWEVKEAIKQACNQVLDLAAENAEINWIENNIEMESDSDFSFRDNDGNWCKINIKEDSISQIKDWIK